VQGAEAEKAAGPMPIIVPPQAAAGVHFLGRVFRLTLYHQRWILLLVPVVLAAAAEAG